MTGMEERKELLCLGMPAMPMMMPESPKMLRLRNEVMPTARLFIPMEVIMASAFQCSTKRV